MKKILFFSLLLFSIFTFPKDTYALDFTTNDMTITVDSEQTLRDYCYYTYNQNDTLTFLALFNHEADNNNYYVCVTSYNQGPWVYISSGSPVINGPDDLTYYYFDKITFETIVPPDVSSKNWVESIIYTNVDIYFLGGRPIFTANFTFQDIIDYYDNYVPPVVQEEVTMGDVILSFLLGIIALLPLLIPLILVINLCSDMLFGRK